jgi:hypothetical protein
LPIFRSQQQAELLALILGEADAEFSLRELAERTGVPYPSVHREIERAQAAGLVTTRLVGRTRLVRADTTSPYFDGLSDVLVKAFGPPWVLGDGLHGIPGVESACIYGSWAARFNGETGDRPVADIDLLVLGSPDRAAVYEALSSAERRLGRTIQVTIRQSGWLEHGEGTFHDTIATRPMVQVPLGSTDRRQEDSPPANAGRLPPRRSTSPTPKSRRQR